MSDFNENSIRNAIEEMVEGIQVIDRDWRYIYVNKAAVEHGRTIKSELLGKTMMECYPGIESTEMFRNLRHVMEKRQVTRMENDFHFPDGTRAWFELIVEPFTNGILIRSISITDKKKLEEHLRHSQKLESVGRLAGGLAHDLNNKLGGMLIYSEMAKDNVPPDNPASGYLSKIMGAIKDSTQITRQLLAFSRKQVMDLRVININSIVEDAKDTLAKFVGPRVKIIYQLDPELGNITADPDQIEQVLINLSVNAHHAMADGGTLSIETSNVDLDDEYNLTHPDVAPGPYVMVAVTDTGVGMSKEVLEQIFEPFFTTKVKGRGTGLGLSMVHGVVKQSKGHIWTYSEPGMGTVFKLYFPKVAEKTEASNKDDAFEFETSGSESILLVEDDPLLNDAYRMALQKAGYRVTSAPDTKKAKDLFEESNGKFDLLLTDVVLPDGSGRDMARELMEKRPFLKALYMSGYTENTIVHKGILDPDSLLLQKPVSSLNLLKTVRGFLDGKVKKGIVS